MILYRNIRGLFHFGSSPAICVFLELEGKSVDRAWGDWLYLPNVGGGLRNNSPVPILSVSRAVIPRRPSMLINLSAKISGKIKIGIDAS